MEDYELLLLIILIVVIAIIISRAFGRLNGIAAAIGGIGMITGGVGASFAGESAGLTTDVDGVIDNQDFGIMGTGEFESTNTSNDTSNDTSNNTSPNNTPTTTPPITGSNQEEQINEILSRFLKNPELTTSDIHVLETIGTVVVPKNKKVMKTAEFKARIVGSAILHVYLLRRAPNTTSDAELKRLRPLLRAIDTAAVRELTEYIDLRRDMAENLRKLPTNVVELSTKLLLAELGEDSASLRNCETTNDQLRQQTTQTERELVDVRAASMRLRQELDLLKYRCSNAVSLESSYQINDLKNRIDDLLRQRADLQGRLSTATSVTPDCTREMNEIIRLTAESQNCKKLLDEVLG
jgi:hypothetical protein